MHHYTKEGPATCSDCLQLADVPVQAHEGSVDRKLRVIIKHDQGLCE